MTPQIVSNLLGIPFAADEDSQDIRQYVLKKRGSQWSINCTDNLEGYAVAGIEVQNQMANGTICVRVALTKAPEVIEVERLDTDVIAWLQEKADQGYVRVSVPAMTAQILKENSSVLRDFETSSMYLGYIGEMQVLESPRHTHDYVFNMEGKLSKRDAIREEFFYSVSKRMKPEDKDLAVQTVNTVTDMLNGREYDFNPYGTTLLIGKSTELNLRTVMLYHQLQMHMAGKKTPDLKPDNYTLIMTCVRLILLGKV